MKTPAAEVLVEIKVTDLCHTDEFARCGADAEGISPAILGHEGAGRISIDPLITHALRLADINSGFDLMHAGESIRSVVVY